MSEKATATAPPQKAQRSSGAKTAAGPSPQLTSENPFVGRQRTLSNQLMLHLFDAGEIQAKLRISQPGDADEQEADRAAEQVVSATHAPKVQRKCACGGTCADCQDETLHRSAMFPRLHSSDFGLQRAAADQPATLAPAEHRPHRPKTPHSLVVEDDAQEISTHQMRKSQFIALLRAEACATADAVLATVKHSTKGCPYIQKWLSFYEKQSSQHVEEAMHKYAPETAHARSAHEAIRLLVNRIQRATISWAKTGKLPQELASAEPGGFLGAVHSFAASKVGSAILGFLGGTGRGNGGENARIPRKAQPAASAPAHHDTAHVKSQLGTGHSLDSRVQSQMSSAFGYDFSGVRVHTDARATKLSSDLNARAFTIGSDVAFASGEYKPGTLIGDALIAHELAHVVQQSGSGSMISKDPDGSGEPTGALSSQLEQDATHSAFGAVAAAWAGARRGFAKVRANAIPSLRSGLRLQRCPKNPQAVHSPVPVPADTEPDVPSLPTPIHTNFTDLADGKWVSDPTGRKHGIDIERRGGDLFYRLANGEVRRVPRPIDKEKKPPAPADIGGITWGGTAALQTAFSVGYKGANLGGISLLPTFTVNEFGRASAGDLLSAVSQMSAAEISPEGLEYEAEAGTLSPRPHAKRFEEAKRYHLPDAPFSLYVFENRTAEVANDASGAAVAGPWSNIVDLKVSSSGDVSLVRSVKSGEETTTFNLKGPKFVRGRSAASKDAKERTDLIQQLTLLGVHVTERSSRFSVTELQAALDVLHAWKGKKGAVESLKAAGAPTLTLVKDILNNRAEYDPDAAQVRIIGAVELPEEEQRNMVVHEVTHALFRARGLAVDKKKVPEHVKAGAARLHDLSASGDIDEGMIRGPGTPSFIKNKVRSQEDWEQALSTDADLNAIWTKLHTRFRIGDPEGTGDIRGMDAADESRYSGSSRGDVVGHAFDNVTEFLSSFVTTSMAYQSQLSATILRAQSPELAQTYKQLWDWVNTNLVTLGKQNPYDAVLARLQKR